MFIKNQNVPELGILNNDNADLLAVENMYNYINQQNYLKYRKDEYNLMTGDPLKYMPYKYSIKEAKKELKSELLFEYNQTSGSVKDKMSIIQYLKSINFSHSNINAYNCLFTYSTTHAYNLIFEVLAKNGDAIIIPKPNYGFFDFMPARYGLNVITIDLKCENDWFIDTKQLEALIIKYNNNSVGKIKFFYNCNPHNPTGKIMGEKEIKIIKDLATLAQKYNFYIIDDLIYREICFNNYYPVPMANYAFDNTISLLGLSKCFGLASLRSGIVVGNRNIIKLINDKIFHTLDSISTLNIALVRGAFNVNHKKYYKKYFNNLNKKYRKKINLLQNLIYGSEDFSFNKKLKKILGYKKAQMLRNGIKEIGFIEKLDNIQSGFFALLNFSYLKDKTYKNIKIKSEYELFDILYNYANVKIICGTSIMWPNKNMFVGRINFAVSDSDLIKSFYNFKILLNEIL